MIVKDLIKLVSQDEVIDLMLETDGVPDKYDIEDFMKKYTKGRRPIYKNKMIKGIVKNPNPTLTPSMDTEKLKAIQRRGRLIRNYRMFLKYLTEYEGAAIDSYDSLLLYSINMQFGEKVEDACLFNLKELKEKFHVDDRIENLINNRNINELTMEEIEKIIKILHGLIPDSYAFEFEKWRDILGYRLSPFNIEFNKKKLSKFVQLIVYEMTFFGFNEQTKQDECDELFRRKEEVDKYMELPEEEREKHFVKFEDIFRKEDKDSDEEEYNHYTAQREILYNMINTYKILKRDYLSMIEGE